MQALPSRADRHDPGDDRPLVGRVPPHDLAAEAAVLSACMLERDALTSVAWLEPEDFYSEANRRIWEAILYVEGKGQRADVVTVGARLRETDRLQQCGGTSYLAELVDAVPSLANIEAYAGIVRDRARIRQLISRCQQTAADGYFHEGPAAELLAAHEQAVFELGNDPRSRASVAVAQIVTDAYEHLQTAARNGTSITGIATGYERLDQKTCGLHNGELTIVASRPGMGKTSLALDVAVNVASHRPLGDEHAELTHGVAVFSLEMPKEQLAIRLLSSEARVDSNRLRDALGLEDGDWGKLAAAASFLYALPIGIDDTPSIGMLELSGKCRRADAELRRRGKRLRLVIVDYLQLMRGDQRGNREQEISSLSRGLKQLAKELELPVIALAQLSRAVETRGKKDRRPQLSDLRESGAIEQDADNVIFIYRHDYYDPHSSKKGLALLDVAKQRNGPTGCFYVRFNAPCTRFDNLAPDCEPDDTDDD